MVPWYEIIVGAILSNTITIIVKGVWSHIQHTKQNSELVKQTILLEAIYQELLPKG